MSVDVGRSNGFCSSTVTIRIFWVINYHDIITHLGNSIGVFDGSPTPRRTFSLYYYLVLLPSRWLPCCVLRLYLEQDMHYVPEIQMYHI